MRTLVTLRYLYFIFTIFTLSILIYLIDISGIDYFENLCLDGESSCEDQRTFTSPRIGVPDQKIALHVNVHFYTDKELMVSFFNGFNKEIVQENI